MNAPHVTPAKQRARHSRPAISRGIHHLALNTDDMKSTLEFWTKVLGMPLVHALKVPPGLGTGPANRGNPPFECIRHYFLDAGGDALVAFFEMPKGAKQKVDRDGLAGMQHVSFAVSEERYREIRANLDRAGVAVNGPIPVGAETYSIYFFDPNGIRLEFSYQAGDGNDMRVIERWTQTRTEAIAELATLEADPAWLETMTAHLPGERG